jgi:hypothetical protein
MFGEIFAEREGIGGKYSGVPAGKYFITLNVLVSFHHALLVQHGSINTALVVAGAVSLHCK